MDARSIRNYRMDMEIITRRELLAAAAAACAAGPSLAQTGPATGETPETVPAGGPPIKVGLIGCGGYGNSLLKAAFEAGGVEVVGLCDVDRAHLEQTVASVAGRQDRPPAAFKEYSRLLEMPELQAVFIATPPHWHALPFIAACERGVEIYCEKPLAYDPREGRAMVEAAQKHKRIVQVGFQRRSGDIIPSVRKYLEEGRAGRVVQAEVQIHYAAQRRSRVPEDPPQTLDWDLWCGPAPKLPYSPAVGHWAWRLEQTTGHGHLVDWGIHLMDATRAILGEELPMQVTAAGGIYVLKDHITTPDALIAWWDFKRCPISWRHRLWGATEYSPETSLSIMLYCENETLLITDDGWSSIFRDTEREPVHFVSRRAPDLLRYHVADFLEAVRTRRQPVMPVEEGYKSTLMVQLAMIAYETGSRVIWDAASESCPGNEAANALLKREYRAPWQHPYRG